MPTILSATYDTIKAQEAGFPLSLSEKTISIGTLSLKEQIVANLPFKNIYDTDIVFSYNIQTYSETAYVVYGAPIGHGSEMVTPFAHVYAYGGILDIANVAILNIEMAITNWDAIGTSGSMQITLGSDTQTIAYNTPSVVFKTLTSTIVNFSITINSFLTIAGVPQPNSYTLRTLRPLKINYNQLGAGAFMIPVIPVSLVYAPIVDSQKQNKVSTSDTVTNGNTTIISFSNQKSTTQVKTVTPYFQNLNDIQKDLSTVGSILSKVPDPDVSAIGNVLLSMGSAVNTIISAFGTSSNTETNTVSTNTQNSLTIVSSISNTITANAIGGGPGEGDIIEYLYNVKAFWFSNNGKMTLGILGWEGTNQTSMYQLSLGLQRLKSENEGTIDSILNLDSNSIIALQALDPFTTNDPNSLLQLPRFQDVSQGVMGVGGGGNKSKNYTYSETSTESQTTINTNTTIQNESPGFLSFLGIGVTESESIQTQITQSNILQSTTTKSITSTFTLNSAREENYNCWVYYDTIFLSFAFLVK